MEIITDFQLADGQKIYYGMGFCFPQNLEYGKLGYEIVMKKPNSFRIIWVPFYEPTSYPKTHT